LNPLPIVPSQDATLLAQQIARWVEHLAGHPSAVTDAEAFLDACLRHVTEEVAAGDLDAPARWRDRLAVHDVRLGQDLAEPPSAYASFLQHLHHLEGALEQMRRVLEPRRLDIALAAPDRALDRAVLRAVHAGGGSYLRRKEVGERLVLSADVKARSENRVGQILHDLFEQGLLLRLRLPAKGGTHPHYAVSPRGLQLLSVLPVAPSAPPVEAAPAPARAASWADPEVYGGTLHYLDRATG
jgi:hypothetical protein